MKSKKIISIMLCVLLVTASFTGCNTIAVSNEKKDNTGGKTSKDVVMGRYMEENFTLSEGLEANKISSVIKGQQGNLEIYTQEDEVYYCYTQKEDGSFEKVEQPWLKNNESSGEMLNGVTVFYGEDKALYAYFSCYTSNSSYSIICKASEDRQTAELLNYDYLKTVSTETEDYTLYPSITEAKVLQNGNIVIADMSADVLHILETSSGKEISTLPVYRDDGAGTNRTPIFVQANNIIAINATGDKIIVYNTDTEMTEREIQIDDYSANLVYDVDEEGNLYICDSNGISKVSVDGGLWENLVDGTLCSLSMPSITLSNFVVSGTENGKPVFYSYVIDSSDSSAKILKYVYDSTIPSVPSQELTIYSLKENSTIRQAISAYQRTDSDVKINYNVAMQNSGSGTVEDYVKALNTELLAGKGADIIILDGLPMDSYIEKGVLADISDLFNAMADREQIVKEMLSPYVKEQKVYGIPSRIYIPLLLGTKDAVEAGSSLKSLSEYIKNHSEDKVLYPLSSGELTELLLIYYYNEVINDKGEVDQNAVMSLLDIVKSVSEGAQESSYQDSWHLSDVAKIANSMGSSSVAYLSVQKIKLGMINLDSVSNMMLPFSVIADNQYSYSLMNQSYLPAGIVGINGASNNKELAKNFINSLLSEEVQSTKLYDGFPVNSASLKSWFEEQNDDILMGFSTDEGIEVMAEWPKKEYRDEIYNEILKTNTTIEVNEILIEKIKETADKYYSGEATKDETIQLIESSISTYLSE
jgi:ABC-type glycerol-3-phosphate transport system substrate-binding protein